MMDKSMIKAFALAYLAYTAAFMIPPFVYAATHSAEADTSQVQTQTVHYVTLKFTQSSFTLSIRQHIKDSANAFSFTFPTTKQFYDSVKEGQEISSKFKTASFLLSGNIGSRKVVVEKKFTKQEPIYTK